MSETKPYKPIKRKSPILEASKKKGYGPGGPMTPGAKAMRKKKAAEAAKSRKDKKAAKTKSR